MDMLIMSAGIAQVLRDFTSDRECRLDPRIVDIGAHSGQYVLPVRVKDDRGFADFAEWLDELPIVVVDPAKAWL